MTVFSRGTWEVTSRAGVVLGRVRAETAAEAVRRGVKKFKAVGLRAAEVLPTVYVRENEFGEPAGGEDWSNGSRVVAD